MTSTDDWRLRVRLHEHGFAHALGERLEAADLLNDLEQTFESRVAVSIDGPEVFCYSATREQAERAQALIADLARESDWQTEIELTRWHPSAQVWEPADVPLPQSDADELAEHQRRIAAERAESAERGYPEWEIRVQVADREAAAALAATLAKQGIPAERRHRYLLVGAVDEDTAATVADTIRQVAGDGARVTVEGSGKAVQDETPGNPFAVFGGLAG